MLKADFIKIGLICVIGLAACGEEKSEDPSVQLMETTIGEPSAKVVDLNLIGSFLGDSRRAGDLTQLVLKTNGTFHSTAQVECVAPPCNPVQDDGTYKISSRDSRNYITLYHADDVLMGHYQSESRDSSLRLLKVAPGGEGMPRTGWLSMWLSGVAWCSSYTPSAPTGSAPSDCELQNLPIGPCAGQWSCVSNVCNWGCGAPM
jgi:hypothetical protein